MFTLRTDISIGKLRFQYVADIVIENSINTMTDTAVIKLPRNLKLNKVKLQDVIKTGDPVIINLGYDNVMFEEFTGYVVGVKANIPIEILCENEMYALKKTKINPKSWSKVDLKNVIKYIAPNIKYNMPENVDLGTFRIEKDDNTTAKVLNKIKENYKLNIYFKNNILYVYYTNNSLMDKTYTYNFQKNIAANNLEWVKEDDIKIKLKAFSHLSNNTKIEIELGDKEQDAQTRTLDYYNISLKTLKQIATEDLKKLKYSGYKGSITGFGRPYVEKGDIVILKDELFPERAGRYFIDKTTVNFGSGGFRRQLELGRRAG